MVLSAHVPAATGSLKVAPSRLTVTEYCPMVPFGVPSCRGRYPSPDTSWTDCISIVMKCGNGAGVPSYWECHIVAASPSSALLAGEPGDASLAVAVQSVLGSSGGATWPRS